MSLTSFTYGKERVRVLVVRRGADGIHAVYEIEASVMLEGDFADTYVTGDNSKVVATDTIKNTVHVLAQKYLGEVLEDYTVALAAHFLEKYEQVERATVEVSSRPWHRFSAEGRGHPHTFTGGTVSRPFSRVEMDRTKSILKSGMRGVLLLKSTGSAFKGYPRCDYTTLPETDDRIMATEMEAAWTFSEDATDFVKANEAIMDALVSTFASEFSPSVQNTQYLMGGAALAAAPGITEIYLTMPNKHYLPINLEPFGLENSNEVFLPTDEPHGQIEALIRR